MHHRETEVKIRITNLRVIRDRLRKLGFRPVHRRSLEDNTLYDTPDRRLRRVRSILRLRRYHGGWRVTYKGTPAPDPTYKSRLELETEVAEPDAIRAIFAVLGLQPVFRYQKYRCQYVPGGEPSSAEVSVDETPIGNFLEIEGSRRAIDQVARQLGFSRSDYMTTSYGALYLEDCRKKKVPPGDMVFPAPAVTKNRRTPRQALP